MRALPLFVAVCSAWLAVGRAATVDRQTFETDDAVIVEAAGLGDSVRVERQATNLLERSQTVVPPGWPGLPAGVTDKCDTRDGRVGRCVARTVCYWTRSLPAADRSLERSLGACLAGGFGRDASGAQRPLVRGVCCPGLFSDVTTEAMSAAAAAATTTTTTTTAAPSTERASTSKPVATQWWQTTFQPPASPAIDSITASTTTAAPTTTTTTKATTTQQAATTTTTSTTSRPVPSIPTIPPIITHPWQGSSSTTAAPTTTAWWQSTEGPTESTTAAAAVTTTTRRGPTTTAWWQTTTTTAEGPTSAAETGTEEAEVSAESSAEFRQCGRRDYAAGADEDRIVGGVEAKQGEFPWIAGIFKGKRQFCGGSLIDDTHILTAAHCVAHMTSYDVRRLVVRLGDHDIKTDDEADHDEYSVARIIRHKGFSDQTLHTDIALLTLSKKVTFKKNIRPICLVEDDAIRYTGENVTVAGWGSLSEAGRQPSALQKVTLQVWENSQCANSYGKSAPGGIIRSMLCAGADGKDSCSGDSGGPLMHVRDGVVYQVGVVSWGIGCAKPEYPGVYTRVTSLKSWIERNREAY